MLNELNEKQKEAVLSNKKKICVIAGPGCGKTRTLVSRAIYLISVKKASPRSVLILTFSKKAIKEIKKRIVDSLGSEMSYSLNINNLHSFCYQFLRKNYLSLGFSKDNFPIYDGNDQVYIVRKILQENNFPCEAKEIKEVVSIISLCKIKFGYVEQLKEKDIDKYKFYLEYQKILKFNEALDFNDLLVYSLNLLRSNFEIRINYQKKFTNILVDEFQDINDIQWEIIKTISCENTSIFLVGDPNQSIYGFQGSSPELISSFIGKDFWKIVYLNKNYRSTKNIINVSNSFLSNNKNSLVMNFLESNNNNGYSVEIINCSVRKIINEITYLIKRKGVNPNQIAILYRNNYLSFMIENELIFNNIHYEILGSYKFIEREEVKDVLSYLKSINFQDDISLLRILKMEEGIGPKFISKLTSFSQNLSLTIIQYFNSNLSNILDDKGDWIFNKNQKKSILNILNTIDIFSSLLSKRMNLSLFINSVLESFGYLQKIEKKTNSDERKKNIKHFLVIVQNWEKNSVKFEKVGDSLNDFIQYCLISFEDSSIDNNTDNLILSSIHQSKGLEFDFVFFLHLDKDILPSKKSTNINEEKRIFYVGITRAKKFLYLVSNSSIPSYFLINLK